MSSTHHRRTKTDAAAALPSSSSMHLTRSTDVPTALLSGNDDTAAAAEAVAAVTSSNTSNNPFDFDVDFSVIQARRDRARAAKEAAKEEAAHSLIRHMDSAVAEGSSSTAMAPANASIHGSSSSNKNTEAISASRHGSSHGGGSTTGGSSSARRPNLVSRSRTTGTDIPTTAQGTANRKKTNFFNFGKDAAALAAGGAGNQFATDTILEEDQVAYSREPFMVGGKILTCWPYDDYHMVQKLFYEKLLEQAEEEDAKAKQHNGGGIGSSPDRAPNRYGYRPNRKPALSMDSSSAMGRGMDAYSNNNASTQSSIPVFRRPPDPPDIPTAVQGVPLAEFERLAEQRSISIVSTWLFDAGLIDELLVNGGMTGSAMYHQSQNRSLWLGAGGSSSVGDDSKSVQTSEGVEVGAHGQPLEGSTKMDKEIAKLRNSTKRQLALINARLNDGVAATGAEVQELVNAVIITKDDIGRLRELSTYVSNAAQLEASSQFMLTKYPKLKQAINARRNLARCFRELDFFSHIPATCDRLREELHAGEWTAHEWSTLRQVCREHVELEIFLVEAEAGMKQRLEEEEEEMKDQDRRHRSNAIGSAAVSVASKFGRQTFVESGLRSTAKNELIDRFLEEHVENVWELGDEIRLRIMSGVASAFDLAMNNPAGMVALVEAVEVYEAANEDYKAVHGEEAGGGRSQTSLRFTDMRAAALGELYKDFESRGLEVFRELTMQAADIVEEEEEVTNQQFSAVLRAANELASEIGIVKEQMAPCFPPNWAIETIWTVCVAHVCSTNILQTIGGPDGQRLPDLTVTQLLDLVAWVETFREIVEEAFPNISNFHSTRTYLHQAPRLLVDNNKTVDIELAKDSLAWVTRTLWNVHDLAKDEFLFRTKEQTEEWLENVYNAEHTKSQTSEGRLVTSLCEDVYALAGVQLRTIRDRLPRRSEALVQAVGVIFKNLYEKQISSRDIFCTDFETCCAAANDFVRMSEKCEEVVAEIQDACQLSPTNAEILEEQAAAVLGLYSSDAVYAAQKTHIYCFDPIEEAIAKELFTREWENNLTHNELLLTLVRTLDDFMEDLETFLDEVMVQKAVEAQISSSVNFYLRCLLTRASEHKSNRDSAFESNERALERMRGDEVVMREYFDGLAENMPTLGRVIENEFSILEAVLELLNIAAGLSNSDAHDFVLVLQKRVCNFAITKFVVGDLFHLVKPQEERHTYEMIDAMEAEMSAVAPTDEKAASVARDRNTVPGLRIDEMMAHHCGTSDRTRPLKEGRLEMAQKALLLWRKKQ